MCPALQKSVRCHCVWHIGTHRAESPVSRLRCEGMFFSGELLKSRGFCFPPSVEPREFHPAAYRVFPWVLPGFLWVQLRTSILWETIIFSKAGPFIHANLWRIWRSCAERPWAHLSTPYSPQQTFTSCQGKLCERCAWFTARAAAKQWGKSGGTLTPWEGLKTELAADNPNSWRERVSHRVSRVSTVPHVISALKAFFVLGSLLLGLGVFFPQTTPSGICFHLPEWFPNTGLKLTVV